MDLGRLKTELVGGYPQGDGSGTFRIDSRSVVQHVQAEPVEHGQEPLAETRHVHKLELTSLGAETHESGEVVSPAFVEGTCDAGDLGILRAQCPGL